jgi:hypothetical protein
VLWAGAVSLHLIPRIGGLHRNALNLSRALRVVACTQRHVGHRRHHFVRLRQRPIQTVSAPNPASRFIDFFNSLADASITKKLLRELSSSHTIAMSLKHQPSFPRMGLGTALMLRNQLLELKIKGDLKASVAALETQLERPGGRSNSGLSRGAARHSPNSRASATVPYLSRKL